VAVSGDAGMRRRLILIGPLLFGSLQWGVFLFAEDVPGEADVGSREPVLEHIAPGTIVGSRPPKMWTDLVIKSLPRLGSGDLGSLPSAAARTAALFRTVIVAEVRCSPRQPGRYELRRIGIGLCAPDRQGRDVVVAPGQAAAVGVELGVMDRMVLGAAERELDRGRIAASTPTFALYRAPAAMVVGNEHHDVEISYAFLVDPGSGDLERFIWARERTAKVRQGPTPIVELPPDLVDDCPLDVKARRLLGAIPVSWSFAMMELPPGRRVVIPVELARLLDEAGRKPINAASLERAFREATSAAVNVSEPTSDGPSEARAATAGSGPGRSERTSTSGSAPPGTRPGAR
jgi:hypothetical protein